MLHKNAEKPINYANANDTGRAYLKNQKTGETKEVSLLDSLLAGVDRMLQANHRPHTLPFEVAKPVARKLFDRELERKNETYSMTDEQEAIFDDMIRYFIGDPATTIPMHKGIYLYGACGVGKDIMFRVLDNLCKVANLPNMRFENVVSKELIAKVKTAKSTEVVRKYTSHAKLEDFGDESKVIAMFGNTEKVIDEFLSFRYELFDRFGTITHITSNVDADDEKIEKELGTRVFDRMIHMFYPIHFPGTSKRA